MKLGTFIAILGEHGHLRDNLCTAAPAEEGLQEHQDDGGEFHFIPREDAGSPVTPR
jgi:hypothetical protein